MKNITYKGRLRKVLNLFRIGVTVEDTSTPVGRFRESRLFDPFLVPLIEQFNPVYKYGPYEFEPGVKLETVSYKGSRMIAYGPHNVRVEARLTFYTCEPPIFTVYKGNKCIWDVKSRHEFQHKFVKKPSIRNILGMLERGWVDYEWINIKDTWQLLAHAALSEYRFAEVVEHLFSFLPEDQGSRNRYILLSNNLRGIIVCCENQASYLESHLNVASFSVNEIAIWYPNASPTTRGAAEAHNPRLFQHLFTGTEQDCEASLVDINCLKIAANHCFRPTPEQLICGDPANIRYAADELKQEWTAQHLQYALDNGHVEAAKAISDFTGFANIKFPEVAYTNDDLFLLAAPHTQFDFHKALNYACANRKQRIYDCLMDLFSKRRNEIIAVARMKGWRPYDY